MRGNTGKNERTIKPRVYFFSRIFRGEDGAPTPEIERNALPHFLVKIKIMCGIKTQTVIIYARKYW